MKRKQREESEAGFDHEEGDEDDNDDGEGDAYPYEEEGGEDDIGYSSDNEVIDNNEWTNLVNRTVAMVFEEV